MSSVKLKNAPLQEVIFELFWEHSVNNLGMPVDEGFDLSQGLFADKLKARFPVHKKLIPDEAPFHLFGMPIHQYWSGEMKWPVVQHGQGMMAVNEVEDGYEWEAGFKPLLFDSVRSLSDSYQRKLNFTKARLQYIDAYQLNGLTPERFMELNLQTQFQTNYVLPGQLSSFNLQLGIQLPPDSVMSLSFTTALDGNTQQPVLLSTILVEKSQVMDLDRLGTWIEFAHEQASTMFKTMLKPDYYASLDQ
jgi:uncharacterized protein (TIGR04255 family)